MRCISLLRLWAGLLPVLLCMACGRGAEETAVYPDRVRLETLGLPAGLAQIEEWHLVRHDSSWKEDWERRRFDSEGRLCETWQTRAGRPWLHKLYVFDSLGRVQRIDHRVQAGRPGGFQRYHYTANQVECQHFNSAGRLVRRERLTYDADGQLSERQTWLFAAEASPSLPAQQHLELHIQRGQDGKVWTQQTTDGRIHSRQVQAGDLSVLLRYDDSGHVASRLLAHATAEYALDHVEGSARYQRRESTPAGQRVHSLFRQADGSSLRSTMTLGMDGEPIEEQTLHLSARGDSTYTRQRYVYMRGQNGHWHLKVAIVEGQVSECWARRLDFF